MSKSGLIVGVALFFTALTIWAGVSPYCTFCLPLFAGLGAGYLAGNFDPPALSSQAMKRGAGAGAIAGGLGLLGQLMAVYFIGLTMQNPDFSVFQTFGTQDITPAQYIIAQLLMALSFGLINVGLAAAFGAAGGAIWFRNTRNRNPA